MQVVAQTTIKWTLSLHFVGGLGYTSFFDAVSQRQLV